MRSATRTWVEHSELAALFFFQAMALGMWLVPLSTVLAAHGLPQLRPYAFAASAIGALVSPLIFGAMADHHASPVTVLRGLAAASAGTMALATWSIQHGARPGLVLALIQIYALCAAPTGSIASTIVFSRLTDSQREFGPIRAVATFGWMCGCWLISALGADTSPLACYSGALVWLALAAFTLLLPPGAPLAAAAGRLTLRQRLGWDALGLLKQHDHRVVFVTAALLSIPFAAFYPFTPPQLQQLGLKHTAAWMSLGQVTEIIAMFALARLFATWRLKWIFTAGLTFGVLRYALCAMNERAWVLAGVSLHGFAFTLFFITAQIYLEERVEPAWRARAQGLMWLMIGGVGNLLGYLGSGFWFNACARPAGTHWPLFWGGLTTAVALVLIHFITSYHGQGTGMMRVKPKPGGTSPSAGGSA